MIQTLGKILKPGEMLALLISGVALVFRLLSIPFSSELLMIGLSLLAVIYFLHAHMAKYVVNAGPGFAGLFVGTVRKVAYIGISVLCIAYLFAFLHLPGANEMLIIGLLTLVICLIASMILLLVKREHMAMLRGPVVRSIAALLLYFITPFI